MIKIWCCHPHRRQFDTFMTCEFQGIATHLLKAYISNVQRTVIGIKRILLICRSELIPLYTRGGFTFVGKSHVVLGSGNDSSYTDTINFYN